MKYRVIKWWSVLIYCYDKEFVIREEEKIVDENVGWNFDDYKCVFMGKKLVVFDWNIMWFLLI